MKRRTFILGGGALATLSLGATATNASLSDTVSLGADFRAIVGSGELVYAINSDVRLYQTTSGVYSLPQSNDAQVIGDAIDIVSGSRPDVPYIGKERGDLNLYATWAEAGADQRLTTGPSLAGSGSRTGAGEWPQSSLDGPLVISADDNNSNIIGVAADGSAEVLASPGNGCSAVCGVADIDEDGNVELVFLDGSAQLRYLDDDGTTITKINNGSVGTNNGPGIGKPEDFGLGIPEIPHVDGSNNPALIDYQGNKRILNSNGVAAKSPVAPVDIDGDSDLEFLYISANSGDIEYIDEVGSTNRRQTLFIDGSTVQPNQSLGLASGAGITYDVELSSPTNDPSAVLIDKPVQDQTFTAVPDSQGNVFEVDAVDVRDDDSDADLIEVDYEIREGGTSGTVVGKETVDFAETNRYNPSGSPAETISPDAGYSIQTDQLYTLTVTGTDANGNFDTSTVQNISGSGAPAVRVQEPSQDQDFAALPDGQGNQFEVQAVQVSDNDNDDDIVEVSYDVYEGGPGGTLVAQRTDTLSATDQYQPNNDPAVVVDSNSFTDSSYTVNEDTQYTLTVTGTDADGNIATSTVQDVSSTANNPNAVRINKPTSDQNFTAVLPQGNRGNVFEIGRLDLRDDDGDADLDEIVYEVREGGETGPLVANETVNIIQTDRYRPVKGNRTSETIQPDSGYTIKSGQQYTLTLIVRDADDNFATSVLQDTP